MSEDLNFSTLSLNSNSSQQEDWDRSLILESDTSSNTTTTAFTTPRNSVAFPADTGATPGRTRADTIEAPGTGGKGKRTLSELLRLHAEKGTDVNFSQEEASRVADVLGQWINASSSPYEGEDDFFSRSHDDSSIPSKKSPSLEGRPRGQSESANSRPPSSTGFVQS
ncbi:hypothetical protein Hypma_003450 [Hypsizygus marmoreus]|uniref:Uncharacterized protein n=1 Tax=Hypsizygus marmoreus TaxID=39966 RepID=A0A369JB32_HYPMA|nr:hypothetical protein Hypma_003450 [Hypsizygus marmoreus]